MADETVAEVGKIKVVVSDWEGNTFPKEMAFEWVEPSNYCLFPDEEYSHTLTETEARTLIAVLKRHFDI